MPAIHHPFGALPARFRRLRVLVIGCGDVGQRVAHQLQPVGVQPHARGPRVLALTSSADSAAQLAAQGIVPLRGNLDAPATLRRLAGVAHRVLHLAPPLAVGAHDTRTTHLLQAVGRGRKPQALVYGSTTGVYGDCAGAWVDEHRAVAPGTDRARRRVDAENQLRQWGVQHGVRVSVLRIPGIYAPNRVGGTPRARLAKGWPVLQPQDDVFTNHIHADDLAAICIAALWRGQPQRVYHANDDTELRMGDYLDLAADLYGMPRPPRTSWVQAQQALPATMLSFMGESRRLRNARLKRELRVQLRWPTVREGLRTPAA